MVARKLPLGPSTKELNSRHSWTDHTACCGVWRPAHFGHLPQRKEVPFATPKETTDEIRL